VSSVSHNLFVKAVEANDNDAEAVLLYNPEDGFTVWTQLTDRVCARFPFGTDYAAAQAKLDEFAARLESAGLSYVWVAHGDLRGGGR
jgi:hypothetical protein